MGADSTLRADSGASLLWAAARNLARDFVRAKNRQALREISFSLGTASETESFPLDTVGSADSCDPAAQLLAGECRWHLIQAIRNLEPIPRTLFVRHHVYGESLDSLAESIGRSKEAVRRSIRRAARQVAASLARRGYSAEDFRRYFAAAPPD